MPDSPTIEALLLEALYSAKGAQHILDVAHNIIQKPLILVDEFKFILAETKGASSIVQYIDTGAEKSPIEGTDDMVLIDAQGSMGKTLHSLVYVYGVVVAHLGITEIEEPIHGELLEFVRLLCKILSIELRKGSDKFLNRITVNELFFEDILEQRLKTDETISNRLLYLDWKPKDEFVIIAIPIIMSNYNAFMMISIQGHIRRLIPDSLFTADAVSMTLLVTVKKGHSINHELFSRLSTYLRSIHLRAGISGKYAKLYNTHFALKQAFFALEAAKKMNNTATLVSYDDYAVYNMIQCCSKEINLHSVCLSGVFRLIEYDENHTMKLTPTLRCYLNNAQNIGNTSTALHIHRNSLTYRIEKLKEVLGVDFENGYDIMRLNLSFEILDYLEKSLNTTLPLKC
jgi:sugar diacid utilization regulator